MNDFEEKILAKLRKDYRLKIEDANFAKGLIPVKILLDGTRNIHSYLVLCEKKERFRRNYEIKFVILQSRLFT